MFMYFDVLGVCAFDFQEIIDLKGERVASSQDRSELRGMHACRTCKNMTNSLGYNLSLELDPGEQHDTYAFRRTPSSAASSTHRFSPLWPLLPPLASLKTA